MRIFSDFYYPILKCLTENAECTSNDCFNYCCNVLNISDEEKSMYYEKSGANIVKNKFRFAILYLKKSSNIIAIRTGVYSITDDGRKYYNDNKIGFNEDVTDEITKKATLAVSKDPNKNNNKKNDDNQDDLVISQQHDNQIISDPYDKLENSINEINDALEFEILEKLHNINPYYFEKIILDLLYKMGYAGDIAEINAKILTSKSNDGGIDGILNQDRLGLHQIYIQAKRYADNNIIGRETIQLFIGAMSSNNANYGIFVTTSDFNSNAIKCVEHAPQKIKLINGKELAKLMVEYNLGVSTEKQIPLKRIDNDYFDVNE